MPNYDLTKILPHKPPMILPDDILEYNLEEKTLTAVFDVYPGKMFYDESINGISSLVGIEFMAQAIGCYSHFETEEENPKPGLLLGARLFNNSIEKFEAGERYNILVHEVYSDNDIFAFDCKITDKYGTELQSACIKAYKGKDIEELLK